MKTDTPNSTRLLIYGRDPLLLDTRRLVLQMAGFAVHSTKALPEVQTQLATSASYGLLIVCHTASAEDRHALAAMAAKAAVPVYQIETLIAPAALLTQASFAKR